jgi:hypothetical protein
MKKKLPGFVILIIIVSILTISSTLLLLSSCENEIGGSTFINPNIITTNSGNAFLTYQKDTGDTVTTYVQKLGIDGEFLWEENGMELYSESSIFSVDSMLVSSDNNSTIILWEQSGSIMAQKIDSNGNLLWEAVNIPISGMDPGEKAISDGSGGVIIAWLHNSDLYLQRINNQGKILWATESLLTNIYFFDISGDNSGNVFIVTEDNSFNVCAQKVDSTGNLAWANSGTLLSAQDKPGAGMSKIVSNDGGGAVITWICSTRNENKAGYSNPEIYAQRLDTDGNILWQTGGIPVCVSQGDEAIGAAEPRIIDSKNGSVIILWRNNLSIYTQRIDADGNPLWADNGVEIWNGGNIQGGANTNIVSDNNGGLIVVWCYTPEGSYTDNDMVIRTQRVSIDGQKLWGKDGVKFSNDSTNYSYLPLIAQNGNGGIIAVWEAGRNVNDTDSSYMQEISSDGELLWGDGGIKISN